MNITAHYCLPSLDAAVLNVGRFDTLDRGRLSLIDRTLAGLQNLVKQPTRLLHQRELAALQTKEVITVFGDNRFGNLHLAARRIHQHKRAIEITPC